MAAPALHHSSAILAVVIALGIFSGCERTANGPARGASDAADSGVRLAVPGSRTNVPDAPDLAAPDIPEVAPDLGMGDGLTGAGEVDVESIDPGTIPDPLDVGPDPVDYLRRRRLLIPVAGIRESQLAAGSFAETRGSGRPHAALDIMAPRGTPVIAAEDGWVTRIHQSAAGGNMVYTVDRSGNFVLFYAHLDEYDPQLREGMPISRGDTLGTVGFTGNAAPTAPHLHFAILKLDEKRRWWAGTAIDPYPILVRR